MKYIKQTLVSRYDPTAFVPAAAEVHTYVFDTKISITWPPNIQTCTWAQVEAAGQAFLDSAPSIVDQHPLSVTVKTGGQKLFHLSTTQTIHHQFRTSVEGGDPYQNLYWTGNYYDSSIPTPADAILELFQRFDDWASDAARARQLIPSVEVKVMTYDGYRLAFVNKENTPAQTPFIDLTYVLQGFRAFFMEQRGNVWAPFWGFCERNKVPIFQISLSLVKNLPDGLSSNSTHLNAVNVPEFGTS